MAGVPLTEVEHHPYLGIELDNMLYWDIESTSAKYTIKIDSYSQHDAKELHAGHLH